MDFLCIFNLNLSSKRTYSLLIFERTYSLIIFKRTCLLHFWISTASLQVVKITTVITSKFLSTSFFVLTSGLKFETCILSPLVAFARVSWIIRVVIFAVSPSFSSSDLPVLQFYIFVTICFCNGFCNIEK